MIEADLNVVKRLMDHLVKAFEEFEYSNGRGLQYIDALMGCHNFYKAIIFDLEERSGQSTIRRVVLNTMKEALFPRRKK